MMPCAKAPRPSGWPKSSKSIRRQTAARRPGKSRQSGSRRGPWLAEGLRERGWEIEDVTAYRTVRAAPPPATTREMIKTGGFDAVCFTSSSTVRNLVGIAGKPHARTIIACIGPKTAETAAEFGLRVDVQPDTAAIGPLVDALAELVVSCTGAVRPVVSLADVHHALAAARRDEATRPLVICDLGMPRDVDPAVARLPCVWVVDVDSVQHEPSAHAAAADVEAARHIVAAEVASYLVGQRMAEVTPTVTALRQRAAEVVEAELLRLDNRLPGLQSVQREEVARTVRRVVDKLLHAPTVRIKQLASAPGGDSYAEALRELFELDQTAVDAVATAGELPVVPSGFDAESRRGGGDMQSSPKRSPSN